MSDPNARLPSIVPLNFWKEYEPQPDGTMKEVAKVEWTRKGTQNTTTIEKISRLSKLDINGNPSAIWEVLKPSYERWLSGQESPVDGTPLAAWPGATPQLVKALEPYHIRSVEDLADLTDGTMAKIPVPGIRGFRDNAKAYVTAIKTTAPIAGEIAGLREQNTNYERRINELEALVKSLAADKGIEVTDEIKRGPGRPKKVAA
jgi:hypothetical protein